MEKNYNDCNLCKAGFELWVANMNFDSEKEEEMRKNLLDYCPSCRFAKKQLNFKKHAKRTVQAS